MKADGEGVVEEGAKHRRVVVVEAGTKEDGHRRASINLLQNPSATKTLPQAQCFTAMHPSKDGHKCQKMIASQKAFVRDSGGANRNIQPREILMAIKETSAAMETP